MTPEERKAKFAERMQQSRKRREALEAENIRLKALVEAGIGTPQATPAPMVESVTSKEQCVICGVEFFPNKLEEHMLRAHGEMPKVLRPEQDESWPPGTVVHPEGGGLPFKVRWTKERLAKDCDAWDGNPDHVHWELIDPADLGLPTKEVTYQGLVYTLVSGQQNRVPSLIASQLRVSHRRTLEIFRGASVGSILPIPEEAVG